jgi:hypothetical protein
MCVVIDNLQGLRYGKMILTSEYLPPDETPVLILIRGNFQIGERVWEKPLFEETHEAFWFWDSPSDGGKGWQNADVTAWTPLPDLREQLGLDVNDDFDSQ